MMSTPSTVVTTVVDPANPNGTAILAPSHLTGHMPGLALASGLHLTDTISKGDVVAIVRQEAEESLTDQKFELDKRLRGLEEQVGGVEALIEKIVQRVISKADLKHARAAAKALGQFTGAKYEAVATLKHRDDEKQIVIVDVNINKLDVRDYEKEVVEHEATIPYTNEMIDHLKTIKGLRSSIAKLQAELLEVKKNLANLPALERKAHAELARATLAKTGEGQELLARLRNIRRPIAA